MKALEKDLDKLGTRSSEIDPKEDEKLLNKIIFELESTILKKNLVALAAPQIGFPYRVFCLMFKDNSKGKPDIRAYINPVVAEAKGFTITRQRCVNLGDREFIHPRYAQVHLQFQDKEGEVQNQTFIGQTAFAISQCTDLLDGMLLSDIGLEIDELFDQASEEEKMQLVEAYSNSLGLYRRGLEGDIRSDPELKQLSDAVDYMQAVRDGRVVLEGADEISSSTGE